MKRATRASAPQRSASDPAASAWVSANAGSGKTHVLIDRVARLLLAGSDPAKIMCLTFTKAAAAEMSDRLFKRLGEWVTLGDGALLEALENLGVTGSDAGTLIAARRLFTRTLETPGGLKIQTIHAFCERVLQAFPIEAGVVPNFIVLDERSSEDMLIQARDAALTAALAEPDSELGRAASRVVLQVQAEAFDELLQQLLSQRSHLAAIFNSSDGIDVAVAGIRRVLGIGDGETEATVRDGLAIDPGKYVALAGALLRGTPASVERAAGVRQKIAGGSATLLDFESLLLTDEWKPRSMRSIAVKAVRDLAPWLESFIETEQVRLIHGLKRLADFERIAATRALLELTRGVLIAFEHSKRRAGAYDFEDLILRTSALLAERPDAMWVLFKLDGGIEHLLVDEAQDTSPAQWDIIKSLTREFFAGSGRHAGAPRTVFAVGDRKQSIFSFQGADPDVFASSQSGFGEWAMGAGQDFRDVPLTVSFRTVPEILQAVDLVFAKEREARKGLDGAADLDWLHQSSRAERGLVELWPLVEPEDGDTELPWSAPVDREPARSPRRRLAAKLATTIAGWIGRRHLPALNRAVQPGDILILVRKRDTLFDALIRELRSQGVPVSGADRLKLARSIAVKDLLALAQVALMPEDDYALACVLKCPALAKPLSEDQLMALAIGRGSSSLWEALRSSGNGTAVAAAAYLGRLAAIAPAARPYEFFAGILVQSRQSFLTRLGSEANDALDALLGLAIEFESDHAASLPSFLNWFASGESEIKRDMDKAAGEVRIMTVHGAKGLEAPIVFLPDTTSTPDRSRFEPLYMIDSGNGNLKVPFWPLSKRIESDGMHRLKQARADLRREEYHRLLYVAMTRPRDELYVCGYRPKRAIDPGCWYESVRSGLAGEMRETGGVARMGPDPQDAMAEIAAAPVTLDRPPAWLTGPVQPEPPGATAQSVTALSRADGPPVAGSPTAAARGTVIHRILEVLAETPPDRWPATAFRMGRSEGLDQQGVQSVLELAGSPVMRAVLGADGLSEVPVLADLPDHGGRIAGRIDRMVVSETGILAVDYKTGARWPETVASVDPAELRQMALYRAALRLVHPGQPIEMALLYTSAPLLLRLPGEVLDRALDQIAVNPA